MSIPEIKPESVYRRATAAEVWQTIAKAFCARKIDNFSADVIIELVIEHFIVLPRDRS